MPAPQAPSRDLAADPTALHHHQYVTEPREISPNGIVYNCYYPVMANAGRMAQLEASGLDFATTSPLGFEINSLEYYIRYYRPIFGTGTVHIYSRVARHPERKTCLALWSLVAEKPQPETELLACEDWHQFPEKNAVIQGTAVVIATEKRRPMRIPDFILTKLAGEER